MEQPKGLLTRFGETLDRYQAEQRSLGRDSLSPVRPKSWLRLLRWFLPNGGTLLLVAILIFTQNVWAGSSLRNLAAESAGSTGTIAYQGRLADTAGAPLTQTVGMEFRLYAQASGGAPLWTETWTGTNSVAVSDGLFNVMLGSLTPIPQNVITGNSSLFLGVTVGSDSEMVPRVQLGSVPFAVQALSVPDGSITIQKLNLGNLYGFSRGSAYTITYVGPSGQPASIDLSAYTGTDWQCDAANQVCYKPGVLSFNLAGSASIACTLLHSEDDNPSRSRGIGFATDSGNDALNPFGGNAAIVDREGVSGIPITTNTGYKIMCW